MKKYQRGHIEIDCGPLNWKGWAMRILLVILAGVLALVLVACGGGGGSGQDRLPSEWNEYHLYLDFLVGQKLRVPTEPGSINYVTMPCGLGRKSIKLRYRIDVAPGVTVRTSEKPRTEKGATISLYFQRAGDNWYGSGPYEAYRWFAATEPLKTGVEETVEASLVDGPWRAIFTSTRVNNPSGYNAALVDCDRIGFTLGGNGGLGHGVWATGEASITILAYELL